MANLLYRLAHRVVRRGRLVIAIWVVILAAMGGSAVAFSGSTNGAFSIPGTESQQALDLLNDEFPGTGGATARVVVQAPEGKTLGDDNFPAVAQTAIDEVAKAPQVIAVTPFDQATVSKDGRTAFIDVSYAVSADQVKESSKDALEGAAETARDAGLQVEFSGGVVSTTEAHGASAELIGVAIAFLILTITFGALTAAGMPLVSGIVGVALGLLGIQVATGFIDLNSSTPALATMLGLAVGIDYALFIISRHRDQMATGMAVNESIAVSVATAGGAVVFAGATVIIALAALAVAGIPFLTAMGLAAAATVAVSVAVNLTLVPAILAVLGIRVEKGSIKTLRRRRERRANRPVFGATWARVTTKKPWLTVLASLIAVGVVALPALDLRLGLPDDGTKSSDTTERRAYDLLSEGFGPGFNGPLTIVISTPGQSTAAEVGASAAEGLVTDDDVAAASPPIPNEAGNVAILSVTPRSGPSSQATSDLVNRIRDRAASIDGQDGVSAYVTGQTAINIDVSSKLASALPVFLSVIIVLAFLLLMLVFRSLLVPLKAVVGFLLSIAASIGATVFIFQQGHLGSLFGVETPSPIVSFLPILLIGILFGLAMDYEVFLVSRVREDYVHRGNPEAAIHEGMRLSARVVTAAGLIMFAVFAGFIFGGDVVIKSLGLGLAFGVLVDAFLVRMTLVPAVLHLLGHSAWALPRWLDKALPDLDIEGAKLDTSAARKGTTTADET